MRQIYQIQAALANEVCVTILITIVNKNNDIPKCAETIHGNSMAHRGLPESSPAEVACLVEICLRDPAQRLF
jgi:hypothetical protein